MSTSDRLRSFSSNSTRSTSFDIHRSLLFALCFLLLFSFSTAQNLVCSQVPVPTGARLSGIITDEAAQSFTSYISVEKSTSTLLLLEPQGRFASFLVYNITTEGDPVYIERDAVFGSLTRRAVSEEQEILQDSSRNVQSLGKALYMKNYQGSMVMGLVGSSPFHGAYNLQRGTTAFSFVYEGRFQNYRTISSGSNEVWFSPGPKDLLINDKMWVYLDDQGNVATLIAQRENGVQSFDNVFKRVITETMGEISSLLRPLFLIAEANAKTKLHHASSLSIKGSTNLLESLKTTEKTLVGNNVLSYLSRSDLATATLSVIVTSSEAAEELPSMRIFVLSWKDNVLSQAYYAATTLPSTSNIQDVTLCQQDMAICVLQETHLSIFPLRDVTQGQSYQLPSSNAYLKWLETSRNYYLISSTAIHRITLPERFFRGRLEIQQSITFDPTQTLQPKSVSIFERNGKEVVFYNTISQTTVMYCFANLPLSSQAPSPRPTPRPNVRPTIDSIPTTIRIIPNDQKSNRVNQTFSRVRPQRTEHRFVPNSVILVSANEPNSSSNSSKLPTALTTAPLAFIGLPSVQPGRIETIRVGAGSPDARLMDQGVLSSIISSLCSTTHPLSSNHPLLYRYALQFLFSTSIKPALQNWRCSMKPRSNGISCPTSPFVLIRCLLHHLLVTLHREDFIRLNHQPQLFYQTHQAPRGLSTSADGRVTSLPSPSFCKIQAMMTDQARDEREESPKKAQDLPCPSLQVLSSEELSSLSS
eukprot:TRINITY_DN2222_c0_g1_i1.p1 TRINITY_DN2222_c0_g1~~TRINITY_DN2222_c0_g1_i1.p1  ORF type:complete len:756 (-),score=79.29 TRINITY_DN2222_c0_g1_i1:371-2638(-)